jgi:hypothetical protein
VPGAAFGDDGRHLGDGRRVLGGEQTLVTGRLLVDVGGHTGPWTRHSRTSFCAFPARSMLSLARLSGSNQRNEQECAVDH